MTGTVLLEMSWTHLISVIYRGPKTSFITSDPFCDLKSLEPFKFKIRKFKHPKDCFV